MSTGSSSIRRPPSPPDERPESDQHPHGEQPAVPVAAGRVREPLPLLPLAIVSAALMALCFAQAPGDLIADTKLDLVIDPGGFLDAALHLWDPSTSFGQIQNQAVGYLFPMGPFFLLGHELGVPMWIVQRIWLGLVLIVALWGVAALARQLDIGRPVHWIIAGVAYALSPFFVGQLASTSAALLPGALAPWALLPLVHGSRGGSTRRAAGLSGLAVAAMGGVNATATVAVLPLPALWLVTRRASPRRRSLAAWWIVALALATAWWLLPLFLQQQWGLDFLRFTETAEATELATSAFEGVRGTGNWVAYLNLGGAWLPAGWSFVTTESVVLASALLAAAGFVGLARPGVPERGFLVASVLVGAVLVCAGYLGPAGGVLDGSIRSALDGPLDAFRNVYKFEPLLRLPLALGLAAALAAVPARRVWTVIATAVATGVVLLGALPLLQGDLPQRGAFERVPDPWRQAANFLERRSDDANTLLVPAAPFGEYAWGRPLDEPMQPIGRSPWAARTLIPLGGAGSIAMMDAIEQRLQSGVASPGLEKALARAGIRYVVARHNLDWRRAGGTRPVEVHDELVEAGLRRVAAFGPRIGPPTPRPQASGSLISELGIARFESRLPEIEIFKVDPTESLVKTLPAARSIVVSGGPQSVVELTEQGIVRGRDPAITVADLSGSDAGRRWAVTDALRRTDTDLGLVHDKDSYTLGPYERAAGATGPPRQLLDAEATGGHEAVSYLSGQIAGVTASSYGSWLLHLPFVEPANAFDGADATAWVTGDVSSSVGEWVEADLRREIEPSGVRVRLLEDGPWRPLVTRLRVTTASGSVVSTVQSDESLQTIAAPPGATEWVRIAFAGVENELAGGATAGLREIQVLTGSPGAQSRSGIPRAKKWVRVPQEQSQLAAARRSGALAPAFAFSRLSASPRDALRRDQETQLRRIFEAPKSARVQVRATAVPARGRALDRLLTRTNGMSVSASSSWLSLPEYRAGNLVDGSRRSTWLAAPTGPPPTSVPGAAGLRGLGAAASPRFSSISPAPAQTDADPAIRLRWQGERVLSRLRIELAGGFAAPPRRIRLASPDGQRDLDVPPDGVMRFRPLRTDRLTVTFPRVAERYSTTGLPFEPRVRLPVGVAELDFPVLRDLRVRSLGPDTVVRQRCGKGPSVVLDGRRVPTAVRATAGQVVQLQSLPARICSRASSLALAAGTHRLSGSPGNAFTLSSVTLQPANWESSTPRERPRTTSIRDWDDDQRSVAVGPGPAAYLAIRQNFNDGWEATLGDRRLPAVQLDGWQQGFQLPRGPGGVVELEFAPEDSYATALWLGYVLALALVALVLIPSRRRNPEPEPAESGRRPSMVVLVALGTAAIALVSLPVALAVPAIALLARRKPGAVPWAAGILILIAAVAAVADLNPRPLEEAGAFGVPAQLLTALGLAFLAASLVSSSEGKMVDR